MPKQHSCKEYSRAKQYARPEDEENNQRKRGLVVKFEHPDVIN